MIIDIGGGDRIYGFFKYKPHTFFSNMGLCDKSYTGFTWLTTVPIILQLLSIFRYRISDG